MKTPIGAAGNVHIAKKNKEGVNEFEQPSGGVFNDNEQLRQFLMQLDSSNGI